jgi:hypothetical protein
MLARCGPQKSARRNDAKTTTIDASRHTKSTVYLTRSYSSLVGRAKPEPTSAPDLQGDAQPEKLGIAICMRRVP